jgi:hypothetical protein
VSGRRAFAAVAGAVAVWAVLAGVSGHLSPLARRPLLDGLGPAQAYHWVAPPPELASTNTPPSSLEFTLPLAAKGVLGGSHPSSDGQITVIVADGSIAAHGADTGVRFDVVPHDPARLGPLGRGLTALGNAYEIRATYLPSGANVTVMSEPLDVVLIYPVTHTLYAAHHEMLWSRSGSTWASRPSTDSPAVQQVEATAPAPGYVVAGGVLSPVPSTARAASSTGKRWVTISLIGGAAVALLAGLALILRGRGAGRG